MCTVFVIPSMGFAVLLCFLATALTPSSSSLVSLVSKDSAYECGAHGKFEYCIDNLAGCVIGCHCHPGYYFDTDTKICEPNLKLMQNYRRMYLPEPTPTATVHPTYQSYPTYPTSTTTQHLVEKDHEVTKGTDEISDWLYNQFFKTIESQIISNSNNTKSNTDEKPPTRRSGGEPGISKSKKKTRKSIRGRRKRKHTKERGLRRKLLRITEDDSLFDETDSDYSDSSTSDSDSSSDSNSDDMSTERDSGDGKKSDADCGDDHGHKKVIIFNRRPKLPLPSFIFLPSMDTPYYPPIGLPPPPLVPMYPMVPVPPMAPPMFPFPGPPKFDEESNKSNNSAVDTNHTSTVAPNAENSTQTSTPATDTTTVTTNLTTPDIRRNKPGRRHRKQNLEKILARADGPGEQKRLKHKQQIKLMQKLRDKLNEKRIHESFQSHEKSLEEIPDDHFNLDEIPNISENDTPHTRLHQADEEENHVPRLDDVDFKYLSELIHRVNQSKGRNRPSLPFDLTQDLEELRKLQSSLPTRRNIGSYKPPRKVQQPTDDIYYSNLGRRIASMIRNADSEVGIQLIKDSENANSKNQFHSILNENSFLPRSFWERSVRSPVLQKGQLSEYLDESRTLKHSNEKRLINLENEVEMYASTPHPLSLQDLENILSTMREAHAQFKQPITNTKRSNISMNVNLLPKFIRPAHKQNRLFDAPEKVEYVTDHPETPIQSIVYVELHPAVITNASVFHEPESKYNVPYRDYWMFNQEPVQPEVKPRARLVFNLTSKPIMHDDQVYNINHVRQPFVDTMWLKYAKTNKSSGEYFQKSTPPTKQTTPKKLETKVGKYNNLNYFSGSKHYRFETVSYPLPQQQLLLSPFKMVSKRMRQPLYIHNQLHKSEFFN